MVLKRLLPASLRRRVRRHQAYRRWWLERQVPHPRPRRPRGVVVFAGLSKGQLTSQGKLTADAYLPAICGALREAGFDTRFVTALPALEAVLRGSRPVVVVMIYNEVRDIPSGDRLDAALARADLVFNHPETGRIVADKRRTNEVLTAAGVPMPRMVTAADVPVFSNAVAESGSAVQVLDSGASLDPARYNTAFIDTRLKHDGCDYYASVRLMCIGSSITHAFVRARDASQNDASVHTKDTPVDAELINEFHQRLVVPNWDALTEISRCVFDALGPGFYAHDVLVESASGRVLVCETGFKFDNATYSYRVEPIHRRLPAWRPFHLSADNARNSAPHLVALLEERLAASST